MRVYFLRGGKVWAVRREVETTRNPFHLAVEQLLEGPTEQERSEFDFSTAVPQGTDLEGVTAMIEGGAARVTLSADLPEKALAQVVYTVSQFLQVKTVKIQGRSLSRADFEDETPAILVESPLPFEEVTSPLRVTGTANTFEANFSYELTDTDGLIIAEGFVTATSGTGTRGTFELTVPFEVELDGVGSVIVFEPSAKDGSRTNLVEIPIRMKR